MIIRAGKHTDFDNIMKFYYDLIDTMQDSEFCPKWEKDIYPTRQFIYNSIIQNELFIAVIDDILVGAMVVNQNYAEGYDKVSWKIDANKNQIAVIHVLGVSQHYQGQGIAKKMIAYAIDKNKEKGMKVIRLDVLLSNKPAQKLYTSIGFDYIDTIQLFYEDTGLTDFLLYEIALETK